jgi:hypothetical protein
MEWLKLFGLSAGFEAFVLEGKSNEALIGFFFTV